MGNFFKAIALGLILAGALSSCAPRISKQEEFRKAIAADKDAARVNLAKLLAIDFHLNKQEELLAGTYIDRLITANPSDEVKSAGEAFKIDLLAGRERRLKSKLATFEQAVMQDKAAGFDPLSTLKQDLEDFKYDAAINDITDLGAKLSSASAKGSGETLIEELRARNREQQAVLRARLDDLERRSAAILLKARAPEETKELTAEIADLAREQKRLAQRPELQPELDALSDVVNRWQLFLYQLTTARMAEARATRAELDKTLTTHAILPFTFADLARRADELLDDPSYLGTTAPTCQEILVKVKSLDDLDKALVEFEQLWAWKPERVPSEEMVYLTLLARCHRVVKWQRPVDLQPFMNGYAPKTPDFLRLREMLYLHVLPIYFTATGDKVPQPGETSHDYLDRLTKSSLEEHDWVLLKKIAEAQRHLDDYQALLDSDSLEYLISAENQHAGGQYVMEVMSYCRALISSSKLVPAKYIGQKLEQLKKEHPKEYAEATGLQAAGAKQENP